jgi:hypothetical protein
MQLGEERQCVSEAAKKPLDCGPIGWPRIAASIHWCWECRGARCRWHGRLPMPLAATKLNLKDATDLTRFAATWTAHL